jgi:hypothetical protein
MRHRSFNSTSQIAYADTYKYTFTTLKLNMLKIVLIFDRFPDPIYSMRKPNDLTLPWINLRANNQEGFVKFIAAKVR